MTRTRPRWSGLKPWSGWVAAAAVLVAASAWLASPSSADASATLVKRCEKFRSRPGVIRTPCANWPDDAGTTRVSGVEGEVLWLDAENTGYMVLRNLPQNDSKKQQYQLWIFDQRDKARRICGAVFDSQGERTVVAITPHVRPRGGITAFGVTLEQAGGEVDSDMSNRVAIAKIER